MGVINEQRGEVSEGQAALARRRACPPCASASSEEGAADAGRFGVGLARCSFALVFCHVLDEVAGCRYLQPGFVSYSAGVSVFAVRVP